MTKRIVEIKVTQAELLKLQAGAILREERLRQGIGLRELARRIGVAPGNLCAIEKGKVGLSNAMDAKITKALNVKFKVMLVRKPC